MPLRPNFVQIGFLELKIVISRQKLRADRAAGCTVYKNWILQFTITIYNFQKANLNEIRIQQNTLRTNEIPAIIWNCNCKLELVHYRPSLRFPGWCLNFGVGIGGIGRILGSRSPPLWSTVSAKIYQIQLVCRVSGLSGMLRSPWGANPNPTCHSWNRVQSSSHSGYPTG